MQTLCAPLSQPGTGFTIARGFQRRRVDSAGVESDRRSLNSCSILFEPENRAPAGNGRSCQLAVRRCMTPTCKGGSIARRKLARRDWWASLPNSSVGDPPFVFTPSICFRSPRLSPSAISSLSSDMDEIGNGCLGGSTPRKAAAGILRKLR
eukprot:1900880-Prymnesium_polylepis.2